MIYKKDLIAELTKTLKFNSELSKNPKIKKYIKSNLCTTSSSFSKNGLTERKPARSLIITLLIF